MRGLRSTLVLTTATIGALLLGAAAPAAAAPPRTESGTYTSLFSQTSDCVTQDARTACTDIFLEVSSDPIGGTTACLSIGKYVLYSTGRRASSSSESGCSPVETSAFTVTSALKATLGATPVTIRTVTCNRRGNSCRSTNERTVTVSAVNQPTEPVSTGTSPGPFRDGDCTVRYTSSSTWAPVAGTITIDGQIYQGSGFASRDDFRIMSRDCPAF